MKPWLIVYSIFLTTALISLEMYYRNANRKHTEQQSQIISQAINQIDCQQPDEENHMKLENIAKMETISDFSEEYEEQEENEVISQKQLKIINDLNNKLIENETKYSLIITQLQDHIKRQQLENNNIRNTIQIKDENIQQQKSTIEALDDTIEQLKQDQLVESQTDEQDKQVTDSQGYTRKYKNYRAFQLLKQQELIKELRETIDNKNQLIIDLQQQIIDLNTEILDEKLKYDSFSIQQNELLTKSINTQSVLEEQMKSYISSQKSFSKRTRSQKQFIPVQQNTNDICLEDENISSLSSKNNNQKQQKYKRKLQSMSLNPICEKQE